jgi:CheY-like chemotaxis protein
MVLKILILEDSPQRIQIFQSKLSSHDLYFFDRVSDAKFALLSMGPWDMVFMGHDMDGEIFVPSEQPNTGYQLALFIKENNIDIHCIVLHTMNEDGARKILSLLPEVDWIKFPMLVKLL